MFITLHLPHSTAKEIVGWARACDYLATVGQGETFHPHADDVATVSSRVTKYGWLPAQQAFVEKMEVVYCLGRPGSLTENLPFLRELKKKIENIYARAGAPEQDIFCAVQQAYRVKSTY